MRHSQRTWNSASRSSPEPMPGELAGLDARTLSVGAATSGHDEHRLNGDRSANSAARDRTACPYGPRGRRSISVLFATASRCRSRHQRSHQVSAVPVCSEQNGWSVGGHGWKFRQREASIVAPQASVLADSAGQEVEESGFLVDGVPCSGPSPGERSRRASGPCGEVRVPGVGRGKVPQVVARPGVARVSGQDAPLGLDLAQDASRVV